MMFNLFRTRDKLGKQTQSAEAHNPIRRAALEGQMNALGDCSPPPVANRDEVGFWRASSLRNAEEVKRLSQMLAIHEAREHKRREGLKKATKASADKRRASKP